MTFLQMILPTSPQTCVHRHRRIKLSFNRLFFFFTLRDDFICLTGMAKFSGLAENSCELRCSFKVGLSATDSEKNCDTIE